MLGSYEARKFKRIDKYNEKGQKANGSRRKAYKSLNAGKL
jgi:hypothetical protein